MSTPNPMLLGFTSTDFGSPLGDGRPWGDGTEMAGRADPKHPTNPWDDGCTVIPIIGGLPTMDLYRDTLKAVIAAAEATPGPPFLNGSWQRGHVYIVDWRFNCLRDLATNVDRWPDPPGTVDEDNTAIGLVRRLMQAGVQVRMLLWYPNWAATSSHTAELAAHCEDHRYAATLVEAENRRLMDTVFTVPAGADPLGVVALDMRTADGSNAGSLHQKMLLIRTPTVNMAFAGGVDLTYTRRDAPQRVGDWQSGDNLPLAGPNWPRPNDPARYASVAAAKPRPSTRQGSDLTIADDLGMTVYGERQSWHDQHLQLTGPIVATLENQFAERWRDSAGYYSIQQNDSHTFSAQVIFSTSAAIVEGMPVSTRPLPPVAPAPPTGGSTVQMWRTIPWRNTRSGPPFRRAEFTVLAGISNAIKHSSQLIWIFDQYFWSRSLAIQLHQQLHANPGLRVIIVLPPHADDPKNASKQHRARFNALTLLTHLGGEDLTSRVGIYSMWNSFPPLPELQPGRGIYVHAKVQMYDGNLLVCGSANLNRRSLMCDAELAIAVADPAVVAAHQQSLWNFLFPAERYPTGTAAWPAPNFSQAGSGADFFTKFDAAVGGPKNNLLSPGPSRLIRDPWDQDGALLPGSARRERYNAGSYYDLYYGSLLDATSLDEACEKHKPDAVNDSDRAPLDEVYDRLERQFTPATDKKPARYPFRKQA